MKRRKSRFILSVDLSRKPNREGKDTHGKSQNANSEESKKRKKQEKIFRSRCTLLDEAQFTTFLYRTVIRPRRKEKRTASSVQFSKAKERKRELCQKRKDQGKERSITLFTRKPCTNERTNEGATYESYWILANQYKQELCERRERNTRQISSWMIGPHVAAEFRNGKSRIGKSAKKEGTKEGVHTTRCRSSDGGRSVRAKYSTLTYTFLSDLAGISDPWLGSIAAVGPGSFSFVTPGKALL